MRLVWTRLFFFLCECSWEWVGRIVGVCIIFKETVKLFSEVVVLFPVPTTGGAWELRLLHVPPAVVRVSLSDLSDLTLPGVTPMWGRSARRPARSPVFSGNSWEAAPSEHSGWSGPQRAWPFPLPPPAPPPAGDFTASLGKPGRSLVRVAQQQEASSGWGTPARLVPRAAFPRSLKRFAAAEGQEESTPGRNVTPASVLGTASFVQDTWLAFSGRALGILAFLHAAARRGEREPPRRPRAAGSPVRVRAGRRALGPHPLRLLPPFTSQGL